MLKNKCSMIKTLYIISIAVLAAMVPGYTNAQGCSDAGFCTIGSLGTHPELPAKKMHQQLSLLLSAGTGDDGVAVFTPGLQYDNMLSARWSVQGRLTGNYANGPLGNAGGAGDVFLSGTYHLPVKVWSASFTLGAKLPLNGGNLKSDGRSLPMQYQSSLGTVDLIAGISVSNMHWQFAAGWQQPLSGSNDNQFLPGSWPSAKALAYSPTKDFDRRGDVLLRAAYTGSAGRRFGFSTGLLGIYHLGEDRYTDANISNLPVSIKGSDGLTLNITGNARWKLNERLQLGLSAGVPLVVRDIRPDGLTREFVLAPELVFSF